MDICINGVEAINLKEIVIALNDLLTAIYGIETRLSDLLINIGFDKTQRPSALPCAFKKATNFGNAVLRS
ncbi:hypothetical protein [Nostoc sp.]|uniref:hypothetical protein n=1 Tax=Nostoc sp. TaxID=1180 RepID=UPI002FF54FFA